MRYLPATTEVTLTVAPRTALHPLINGVELGDPTPRRHWIPEHLPEHIRSWVRDHLPTDRDDIVCVVTEDASPLIVGWNARITFTNYSR